MYVCTYMCIHYFNRNKCLMTSYTVPVSLPVTLFLIASKYCGSTAATICCFSAF